MIASGFPLISISRQSAIVSAFKYYITIRDVKSIAYLLIYLANKQRNELPTNDFQILTAVYYLHRIQRTMGKKDKKTHGLRVLS